MRARTPCPHLASSPQKSRAKAGKISAPAADVYRDGLPKGAQWLYGLHAIRAALANPGRRLGRAFLTDRAIENLGPKLLSRVPVQTLAASAIDRLLPKGAVHQGAALEAWPLKSGALAAILEPSHKEERRIVLVLDQISDPQNVGAILRSAAAFAVKAVIVQDRHAPPQTGALAKAACGALDMVNYIEVVNIVRALDELGRHGFWRIALMSDGEMEIGAVPPGDIALVLGSEGSGIRRLVREHCEAKVAIPVDKRIASLNVSNAAAIALYALRCHGQIQFGG